MKKRNQVYSLLLWIVFFALSASIQASAADNIERSCKAYYAVRVGYTETIAGHQLSKLVQLPMKNYEFSARRGCGRTVPDRCRKRAMEAIKQCMVAHANNPATMPAACTSNGVDNYRITNLEKAVQETVCSHVSSPQRKFNLPDIYKISLTGFSSSEDCYLSSLQDDLGYFKVVSCPPR
jgi:hypothetical protein